jgi:flagellar biosynthesis repressor protein FlbT
VAFKIALKTDEKIVINGVVFYARPRGKGVDLYLLNQAKVLRAREILKEEDCDTVLKRIYFAIQIMYLFPEDDTAAREGLGVLLGLAREAHPEHLAILEDIAEKAGSEQLYLALKQARNLIRDELDKLEA